MFVNIWKAQDRNIEFRGQDFIITALVLRSARSQSSMPSISLLLSLAPLSLQTKYFKLLMGWISQNNATEILSLFLLWGSGQLLKSWLWHNRQLLVALSGPVAAFVLPFCPLTGSCGEVGGGCYICATTTPPANPQPQRLLGPDFCRAAIEEPCRSQVALSYSSCLSGVAGNQRHATGAEQKRVCEREWERERDNHTFYMLHLPLMGVALRLSAKCDLDDESAN